MLKRRIIAILILVIGALLALAILDRPSPFTFLKKYPFHLGLDLSGGSHLLYKADVSKIPENDIDDSMEALRDVIERRVNLFGVSEPIVHVETSSLSGDKEHRLSVELPGVTDISEAIKMIGQTPFLEFRTENPNFSPGDNADLSKMYLPTTLTGKYLKSARLEFDPNSGEPYVSLLFNEEGAKLFEKITGDNVGKTVAIYLDGEPIQAPVVQQAITGGQAVITGSYTPEEAKILVGRLNSGALPVPITHISTQIIGATLGSQAIADGVKAATIGFAIVALFLLVWYRLPGLIAVIALVIYIIITLVLYKMIPVTLTAAGIAGLIISIGMAVDANILIFERTREERMRGQSTNDAMNAGFSRAWFSIRDANSAALIVAVILFSFGTPLIKGFALTLGLGVLVSLISAITITRLLLRALPQMEGTKAGKILFSSGFNQK